MKLLRQRLPDVLLLIPGDGPLQEELPTRINEAELDGNVKLLSFLPDQHLAALYRAATIRVVTTVALGGDYGRIVGLDAIGRLAGSGGRALV